MGGILLDDLDMDELGGFGGPCPGRYHLLVQECHENDKGALVLKAEVIAGRPEDQVGKVHEEMLFASDSEFPRRIRLLLAVVLGLTTVDQLKVKKAAGESADIPWHTAPGRHFCCVLSPNNHRGKVRQQMGIDIFPTSEAKAQDIPTNMKAVGVQSAAEGTAPAVADDPFDGIDI